MNNKTRENTTVNNTTTGTHKRPIVRDLALIAIFSVVAWLLMLVRFPLPFMPPFMDFDLAAVPELIGTFLLGPIPGIFIVLVKILLKIITTGSSSAFTGELINFILNSIFVLTAWSIYRIKKTRKIALLSMITATIVTAIAACFANVYVIIPLYAKLYGFDMDAVIGMTQAVNSHVDSAWSLVLLGILPFNLIKNGVATAIVFVIYKRTVVLIRRIANR
jgi:riboflavin transporter FmnP